jgi:hypothetical protein
LAKKAAGDAKYQLALQLREPFFRILARYVIKKSIKPVWIGLMAESVQNDFPSFNCSGILCQNHTYAVLLTELKYPIVFMGRF